MCVRNEIFVVLVIIIVHMCDSLHNYHGTVYNMYFLINLFLLIQSQFDCLGY